ncbi:MAG: lipopolysaccharide biosynthesis protein [Paludibacteraceae bacterium]
MSINNNIRRITKSELVRNSAKLLSANVVAQAIGLLVYPLLTRLYAPEDFGLLNLFLSIGGVLVLFSTAEYQYAIVLPKNKKDAIACFHSGFVILLGVTVLCAISALFSPQIACLFNAPALTTYYPLMCIFVFCSGLWTLLNYWYTRNKQFGAVSAYQLTQSICNAGLKYGFGLAGWLRNGLILSTIIGPLIALTTSICRHFKRDIVPLFVFDKLHYRAMAQQYANFPKFSLPRALINNLSGNLPILLLTPFFGLTEIGYFGMALTLAFRPINMISGSLYQVFFQRTSEQVQNHQSILPFFRKFIKNTLLIVIPSFAILYFVLPWLTEWLLGSGWDTTGEYIRWMLPWLAFSAMVAPICYLSDIFQKQHIGLAFEICLIAVRFIGVMIGIGYNDFTIAVALYSCGGALLILAQLLWLLYLVYNYEKRLSA